MLDYFSHQKADESDKYSLQDFAFRWKKLARVVAKEGLDSLLLITGLDSSDSVPSAYLFNWLFLGLSGKPVTINKYLDTIYNEIIVLISAKEDQDSYIFITPDAKEKLQPLIYGIPNCKVTSLTNKEYEDKEQLDILKITSFYEMVQNSKKMGVFLDQNDEVKIIEKWPIIQSYALEPVGRTFFTLQFQVSNVGNKIFPLFKNLDRHSLKSLVGQTAYTLAGHVKGSVKFIEFTKINKRNDIKEVQIYDSLQQAVDISANEQQSVEYKKYVNVLFGQRTGSYKTEKASKEVSVRSSNALHATIQHFDPYTKMKVWRTFFLSTNLTKFQSIRLLTEEDPQSGIQKSRYVVDQTKNSGFDDGSVLVSLYIGLVQGVLDSISAVSKDYKNLKSEYIASIVFAKIKQTADSIYESEVIKHTDIEVQLQSFDSFGENRLIDFKDSITFKLTSTFYIVKCRLNGVKSKDNLKSLGSLIFSESFLLQQGCYLLLTKNVPYFDFCQSRLQQVSILENLNPNYKLEELGASISTVGQKNRLFIPSQKLSSYHIYLPIQHVKCYFHEKGIRIYSDKFGWKMLIYSKMKNLTMVNKIGEWVLMNIDQPLLFADLQTGTIALQFHGKSFEYLMNKVNNKQNPLNVSFLEVIPPVLSENWYFVSEVMKKQVKEGALMHQHQILQNQFLWSFIQAKQMMIINQMKDIKFVAFKSIYQQKLTKQFTSGKREEKQHAMVVINGTYGSNKLRLAECLKKYGPNTINASIFNVSSQNLYSKLEINTFITMINQHIQNNVIEANDQNVIIVVVPSWIDCEEFFNTLPQIFHIKCVLTTVNVSNFYNTANFSLTQNVLTFAFPGFSQHIIVDTYGQDQSYTNSVMRVIWNLNKQGKVYRTTNSLMTTGQCRDILQDDSFASDYQKYLRSKYGSFYHFQQLKRLSINYLQFKLPIHFLTEIKKLSIRGGHLTDIKAIVEQELKHKREEAESSKDQLMISLYLIEEAIAQLKRKQKSMRVCSFKANLRLQKEDEVAQVSWANQSYKQKLRPADSVNSLGVLVISKNYDELELRKFLQGLSYKKILNQRVQPLKKLQELDKSEIRKVECEKRYEYLVGVEFFDGYFYRDVEGHILQQHPYLDKLLDDWVKHENARIVDENIKIKQQWEAYVKKYQ